MSSNVSRIIFYAIYDNTMMSVDDLVVYDITYHKLLRQSVSRVIGNIIVNQMNAILLEIEYGI